MCMDALGGQKSPGSHRAGLTGDYELRGCLGTKLRPSGIAVNALKHPVISSALLPFLSLH